MRSIAYPAHAAVLTRFGSQLRCAPGWESAGVLGQAFSASRGSNRTRTIRLTPTTRPTSLGSTSLIHRIEVTCAACGGHLEHVFAGGPGDTGGATASRPAASSSTHANPERVRRTPGFTWRPAARRPREASSRDCSVVRLEVALVIVLGGVEGRSGHDHGRDRPGQRPVLLVTRGDRQPLLSGVVKEDRRTILTAET
jgi:hypothetical protein